MSRTCTDAGAGDALSVATALLTAAPFTFVAWAKSSDGVDDFQVVGGMSQAGTDNYWKIRLQIVFPRVTFRAESTVPQGGQATVSTAPSVDVWAHYAAVEIANNDRANYLNGGNKATNGATVVPQGINTTEVGQVDDGSPSDRFIGDIGHAALYNIALSDQEVASLASGVSPFKLQRDNLVGFWPINGQTPEYNVMGTGADLGLVGTPAVAEEPPIPNSIIAP